CRSLGDRHTALRPGAVREFEYKADEVVNPPCSSSQNLVDANAKRGYIMFSILLPLAYFLVFAVLRDYEKGLRARMLYAACIWGSVLFALTELLSLFHFITRLALILAWGSVCIGLTTWLLVNGILGRREPIVPGWSALQDLSRSSKALGAAAVFVLILIAVTAIAAPPNTWDVIYYHMPRVMMWISNRSVGFYPTFDLVQLVYAPGAEYAMLHLTLLAGSDR